MDVEDLKAEVERLRSEVEAYKQRELDDLKRRLAAAEEAASFYKEEANRIGNQARQIAALYNEETSRLKAAVQSHQTIPNTRAK